jgi:cytochrome b pre-mRNA-processing protein 3
MNVKQLFSRRKSSAPRLYAAIVAAARQPALYGEDGAPDTVEGRLVIISLHLSLAIARLRQLNEPVVAQQLVEQFFADIEGNLRESGVSDQAIPKRMRAIEALYVEAMTLFEGAAAEGAAAVREAVRKILADQVAAASSFAGVAARLHLINANLAKLSAGDILAGEGWNA